MDFNTDDQFTVEFGESGAHATPLKDTVAKTHRREQSVPTPQLTETAVGGDASAKQLLLSPKKPETNATPDKIVDAWGSIVRSGMSTEMYSKLVRLASVHAGSRGPGFQALRMSSLNQFLHFWSLVRHVAVEPELALAPDGSIHAEWFKSSRQHLDIRFSESGARFGMFANNNILEGADRRLDAVAEKLKSDNAKPLTWRAA